MREATKMSKHTHRRRWLRFVAAALVATPIAIGSHAADAAIIIGAGEELTRFEIDGDPIKDTHSAITPQNDFVSGDWGTGGVTSAYGPEAGSGDIAPEEYTTGGVQPLLWETMVAPDHPTVNAPGCPVGEDDNWNGGVKVEDITNIDDVSDLTGCGQVLNKGNLVRAYTAYEVVTVGGVDHTVIYGAWERGEDPGELYFYVPISDGVAGNTDGDRLIAFDYDSSSGTVSYRILAWTGAWTTMPDAGPGVFQGAVGFADGDPFSDGNPSFGEFALDLTAAGVLLPPDEGECINYTTADYVFTETGNSAQEGGSPGNAQLKDYISTTPLDLSNCAEVSITKTVNGPADWSFDFTISPVPANEAGTKAATDGSPTVTWGNLLAGEEYTISETLVEGWTGGVLTCTGVTDLDLTADNSVTFVAEAGQDIACAVTNSLLGSITVVKQTDPDGSAQSFGFMFGETAFSLTDGGSETFDDLAGGNYTITEAATDGWALTGIVCDAAEYTTDTAAGTANIALGWGEDVTCTYTNAERGPVTVLKSATGPVTQSGTTYTVGYTLTVTSASEIPEAYTLSDVPEFAPGTTIQSLVVNGPGVTNLDLGADGGEIIAGTIDPHGELVFNVVATFTVDPSTTAYQCGGADTATFNTATVVAFGGNSSSDCEPIPTADVAIVKDPPTGGPFAPGSTFAWTLNVTNNGPFTAVDVTVTDQVPATLVVTSVSSADFSCGFVGNAVTCTRPTLASGASGTIVVNVSVPNDNQATSVTNVGVVTSSTPDTNLANNTDDASVPLVAQQPPPPPPPPVEVLPETGSSNLGQLLAAGAALVAVGGLALLGARRRRAVSAG